MPPLTRQKAAEIAKRHGLSLNDAAGLTMLADDEESAEKLAASFAPESDGKALAERILESKRGGAR